ncbi:hypothetical protein HanHA89_Chr06g0212191 [Helianthus annuus]|nr:hypothetical protein HanHA89_Chr06g0212191 [Helianthus annuus]
MHLIFFSKTLKSILLLIPLSPFSIQVQSICNSNDSRDIPLSSY